MGPIFGWTFEIECKEEKVTITLEAAGISRDSSASISDHTSGTTLPLLIDEPRVEAHLLLWCLDALVRHYGSAIVCRQQKMRPIGP